MYASRGAKIALTLLSLSLVLQAGCFRGAGIGRQPAAALVWPAAPEVPRIGFLQAFSGPADLRAHESAWRKAFKFITGKAEVSFISPWGLEADPEGRLFVVDGFLKRIHVCDPGRNTCSLFPADDSTFASPVDVAVDNRGKYIYVTDSKEALVKVFSKDGFRFVKDISNGAMERPTGIAINEITGELLVVDTVNSHVLRFDLSDHHLKGIIGREGEQKGAFHAPSGIFVTSEGEILVSDSLNFRIQVFSPQGRFLRTFGEAGQAPGYFSRPKGVAADSDGNVYVVDALFDNVQIFNRDGALLMAFGGPGQKQGEFWLPSGIFIDGHDRVYVADTYNKRVQVFQYLKEGGLPDQ